MIYIIPTRQCCTNIKFQPLVGRVKVYSSSFFPKTVRKWNELPANLTAIDYLDLLKKSTDKAVLQVLK